MKRHIAILGSTGSIGRQALEVIREQSEHFAVDVLTANGNAELLIEQSKAFQPNAVVIADESKLNQVREALKDLPIKVFGGIDSVSQIVQMEEINIVLTALVGFAGLKPTLAAINAGKHIALANKETLVVAGELITKAAKEKSVNIYPVDSEHSAIFQCLAGEWDNPIEKIYLTASGGPFRGKDRNFLKSVKKEIALKHPIWNMGVKVSIDSASLMNKGLEMIEAKWLFNLKPEQIDVVIHPQSIVHSIVQFQDGSMKAQMGLPDMKLPIQYAFSYPQRLKNNLRRFDFADYSSLTFEKPDHETFHNIELAAEAMKRSGNMPCILNAANEIAVAAFLRDEIGFLEMSDLIEDGMKRISFIEHPSLEDYELTDKETRIMALQYLQNTTSATISI